MDVLAAYREVGSYRCRSHLWDDAQDGEADR
jgi:hypothetical protein